MSIHPNAIAVWIKQLLEPLLKIIPAESAQNIVASLIISRKLLTRKLQISYNTLSALMCTDYGTLFSSSCIIATF